MGRKITAFCYTVERDLQDHNSNYYHHNLSVKEIKVLRDDQLNQ